MKVYRLNYSHPNGSRSFHFVATIEEAERIAKNMRINNGPEHWQVAGIDEVTVDDSKVRAFIVFHLKAGLTAESLSEWIVDSRPL